ncbi:MAG: protein kinase [Phycisphaerae bacterium]|nr:protein kinase [Phycisphaerae bacterium]
MVHRAHHDASGRTVAVKVLRSGSGRQRARLEREAQLVATLRHPGIVTIHDCADLPDGGFAIVMELVDGVPFDAWCNAVRKPCVASTRERRQRIAKVFVDFADAVSYAHQNAVIHCDLKPTNVLVDAADHPHVLDFGVAHSLREECDAAITRTGEFAGTIAYAAPETLSGAVVRPGTRADVYALGVMLYEAIVGRRPHRSGDAVEATVRAIVDTEPPRPRCDVGGERIEADLVAILMKAVARDPRRRYDSAYALARDLERWISGRAIHARGDSTRYLIGVFMRRNRVAVAASLAAVLLLASGVSALAVLYRNAESARGEAQQQALRLGNILFERNLQAALERADSGEPAIAETLAWREALAPSSPRAIDAEPSDPDFLAMLWTLRHVVAGNPCTAAGRVGETDFRGLAALGDGHVVLVDTDGTTTCVRLDDLAVEWKAETPDDLSLAGPLVATDPAAGVVAVTTDRRRIAMFDRAGSRIDPPVPLEVCAAGDSFRELVFDQSLLWILTERGHLRAVHPASGTVIHDCLLARGYLGAFLGELKRGVLIDGVEGTSDIVALDVWSGDEFGRIATDGAPDVPLPAARWTDGRVVAHMANGLALCDLDSGNVEIRDRFRGVVRSVAVPPDDVAGSIVAALLDDGTMRLVDLSTTESAVRLSGHSRRRFTGCSLLWTGPESLVTAGEYGLIRLWDARPHRWITTRTCHAQSVGRLSFMPDGQTLLSFGRDGTVSSSAHASPPERTTTRTLPLDARSARAAFSADAQLLAVDDRQSSTDRRVLVRRLSDFAIIGEHDAGIAVGPLDFSPDSSRMAAGLGDCAIGKAVLGVFDVRRGTWRTYDAALGQRAASRAIRFSPDGRFLAWALVDGRLFILDVDTPRLPAAIALNGAARSIAFSTDGERLLVSYDDGHLSVLERATGTTLIDLTAHANSVGDVAWSPDGRTFASADASGTVILWCAVTYRRLADMSVGPTPVQTIIFSPTGDRLLIGDDLGAITEWDFGFYDRALARSVQAWIDLLHRDGVPTTNAMRVRAWADDVLTSGSTQRSTANPP